MLDQTQHTQLEEVKQWLRNKKIDQEFDDQKESRTARDKHFQQIKDVLLNQEISSLGKLTPARLDEISSHLANLCLGAPGIVAYRSLKSVYQQAGTDQLLDGAMTIVLKTSINIGI